MKTVVLEYGDGAMRAEMPDSALVVRPETHYNDPPAVDASEAVINALRNPLGIEPLSELARPGRKAVIAFPDRVKGGAQKDAHRKVCIPIIVRELMKGGVKLEDIKLVCAMGLHRKNTREEWDWYLGSEVMELFWPDRIVNHDAEDPDGMVEIGYDGMGNYVNMNRDVFEADIAIMIGHVQGNPYGGYSGGYKMCVTGITGWRSIRSHHNPETMHRSDFVPVNAGKSHMRRQFDSIGRAMEAAMGKRFFCVDAVLGTNSQVLGVYAGTPDAVQQESWKLADRRTNVSLNINEKFDVLVFGQPKTFHYGPGMGTNPILMLQAIGSQVARHKDVLQDNCVVVCPALCDGWFNDDWFPSYRVVYERMQDLCDFSDLTKAEEEVSTDAAFIEKYRHGNSYHPFHAFSMASMGGVALKNTSAIFIPGAVKGGYARGMGMKPTATFDEAMRQAERYAGRSPRILVQEKAFTTVSVHLKRG